MTIYVLVQVMVLWGANGLNWGQIPMPHAEQSRVIKTFATKTDCTKGMEAMQPEATPLGVSFVCVPVEKR